MGSFSIWHWLILLLVIAVPVVLIGGLVWLIVHLSRRKFTPMPHLPPAPVGKLPESADIRLENLYALLEQGHITRDEYERQRAAIISGI